MPEEIDTSNMSAEEIAQLQKENCIFCKIASKQIPSKILHEDDKVICILDINPAAEGHILVFPKEHYMILPHIPDDILSHLFITVKLMSNTLLKSLQIAGTSIFVANGMAAGQKAPHVLIHVFPRREGDNLLQLPKLEQTKEQSEKLKSTLKPYFDELFSGKKSAKKEQVIAHKPEPESQTEPSGNSPEISSAVTKEEEEGKISVSDDSQEPASKDKTPGPSNDNDNHKIRKKKSDNKPAVNLDDIAKLFGS